MGTLNEYTKGVKPMTFEEWFKDTVYTDRDCAKDAWEVAYRQAYSDAYADAAYPIGYVLVPVEPTEAMLKVALDCLGLDCFTARDTYKYMIQAAQEKSYEV